MKALRYSFLLILFHVTIGFCISPYEIYISLNEQRLYLLKDDDVVFTAVVSTGTPSNPTPIGRFRILGKERAHFSEKYDVNMLFWMPFENGYGLHALEGKSYLKKLGRIDSHGCVRLSHEAARFMFETIPRGTPVIIARIFDPPPPENIIVFWGSGWDVTEKHSLLLEYVLFPIKAPYDAFDGFFNDFWGWNY